MNKHAVKQITDILSSEAICSRIGVTEHSVRYARTQGVFPAGWYEALDEMCAKAGVECPRNAFNFRRACHPTKQDARQ